MVVVVGRWARVKWGESLAWSNGVDGGTKVLRGGSRRHQRRLFGRLGGASFLRGALAEADGHPDHAEQPHQQHEVRLGARGRGLGGLLREALLRGLGPFALALARLCPVVAALLGRRAVALLALLGRRVATRPPFFALLILLARRSRPAGAYATLDPALL